MYFNSLFVFVKLSLLGLKRLPVVSDLKIQASIQMDVLEQISNSMNRENHTLKNRTSSEKNVRNLQNNGNNNQTEYEQIKEKTMRIETQADNVHSISEKQQKKKNLKNMKKNLYLQTKVKNKEMFKIR